MTNAQNLFSESDAYYFREGTHTQLANVLGAHLQDGGAAFAVWAPQATAVSVLGDFNGWNAEVNALERRGSGVWEGWVSGAWHGAKYQFQIRGDAGFQVLKADPFGIFQDTPPRTQSILWDLHYVWGDSDWMARRAAANSLQAPISIYEVHLGSWRRVAEQGNRSLTYNELGDQLIPYVKEMGFTHVELLPIMEHPFFGSWGYQTTGFFAPTSRYGTPQDFMRLIDRFHQAGLGVILDWVPSHFPNDEFSLGRFDGKPEYEPSDPRMAVHPDWNSFVFNYSRPEVRSFLLSSAMFWLDHYHADALRVDAVASMLYLDYSRRPGEWTPNQYGGRDNLDAIAFLRVLNEDVYGFHSDVQTIAEESTAWPQVSRPTFAGGLGFGFKWDMGWMHDTLDYFSSDPVYRRYRQNQLTFRSVYAFSENFVLPLSHDEVVYGKKSLLGKMPGDEWQKFANLRALFAYMYAQPGKKLLFMGGEFAQWSEWAHDGALEWALLDRAPHRSVRLLIGDLNWLYRSEPALHTQEHTPESFSWIDASNAEQNILIFRRCAVVPEKDVIVVCNLSPVPRSNYGIGVPHKGFWREILNTDSRAYGGSGQGNVGGVESLPVAMHGFFQSITIQVPPLAVIYLRLS